MKTNTRIRQITVQPIPVNNTFLPDFIKWENIEIVDYFGDNILSWFIELLKKEENSEPNFSKLIHFQEIVEGPVDIYDYIKQNEKNTIKAQPLLVFCLLMHERKLSQQNNEYYAVFEDKRHKFLLRISIGEKIKILFSTYGNNFLKKSEEKKNLLLRVL